MNTSAIVSNAKTKVVSQNSHSPYKYKKVLDGRKQPIRGLWVRNGKYVARLAIEDDAGVKRTQRVTLDGCATDAQAADKLKELQVDRTRNALPILKRTPKFADYAAKYFEYYDAVKDEKRESTIEKERGTIDLWIEHMGGVRLDKISKVHINSFTQKRQIAGRKGRTVNLDVIALRNVLKRALDDGWIKSVPKVKELDETPPQRELVIEANIQKLCADGLKVSRNGREFADYILLMAYSGARRNEALRLKWADVDFDNNQLTIGADGLTKGYETRHLDFNSKLETHLRAMKKRRAPDTQWLFPSPQRGNRDIPAKTFKQTLTAAKEKAKLPKFTNHDCRHFFISYCVMSGIGFMTIASWVGHKDGGVLIGKVYGHLADTHKKTQAAKVNFGPVVLKEVAK